MNESAARQWASDHAGKCVRRKSGEMVYRVTGRLICPTHSGTSVVELERIGIGGAKTWAKIDELWKFVVVGRPRQPGVYVTVDGLDGRAFDYQSQTQETKTMDAPQGTSTQEVAGQLARLYPEETLLEAAKARKKQDKDYEEKRSSEMVGLPSR